MNREIKFRGKNKNIGWTYGQAAYDINGNIYIINDVELDTSSYDLEENILFPVTWFRVSLETVGQFTGLHDKNGKEIYEGDIVKVHYIGGNGVENDKVLFYRGTFCVDYSEDYKPLLNELNHCCEVIGNIYDNPELLGGE